MLTTPRLPDIVVDAKEIPQLATAVEKFVIMSVMVTEIQKGPYYKIVQDLNDLRPLLSRFSQPMVHAGLQDPIAILTALGVKDYRHVGKILSMARSCAQTAAFLSKLLSTILIEQVRRNPVRIEPFRVDPKSLN